LYWKKRGIKDARGAFTKKNGKRGHRFAGERFWQVVISWLKLLALLSGCRPVMVLVKTIPVLVKPALTRLQIFATPTSL
jgi:hypothetical protein